MHAKKSIYSRVAILRATERNGKQNVNREIVMDIGYEEFGRIVTAWRMSRGWTQDDLAKRSGLSKSTVSQVERGTNRAMPKDITIARLAHSFGVPTAILMKHPDSEEARAAADRLRTLRVVEPSEAALVAATGGAAAAGLGTAAMALGSMGVVGAALLNNKANADEFSSLVRIKRLACAPPSTPESVLLDPSFLAACLPSGCDLSSVRISVIVDDSMAPTLARRDLALAVPIRDGMFQGNGVYVVRSGNVCEPRRVVSSMDGGLRVSLDNPLYRETIGSLSTETLRAEARIVFVIRGQRIF